MRRIAFALAAFALIGCAAHTETTCDTSDAYTPVCGWQYQGELTAPADAECFEVLTNGLPIELNVRGTSDCFATNTCTIPNCVGLGVIHTGDTIDAWSSDPAALEGVTFAPAACQ